MALKYETFFYPLSMGVGGKPDQRALEPPKLLRCENAVFDEIGGQQKRPGASLVPPDIFDTAESPEFASISNDRVRAIDSFKNELLVFAQGKHYSFLEQEQKFTVRSDFDSAYVEEFREIDTPGVEQRADAAEVNGVRVVASSQGSLTSGVAVIKYRVFDTVTGALYTEEPITISHDDDCGYPKVRAVGNSIHIYYAEIVDKNLNVRIIDTTDVLGTIGDSSITLATDTGDISDYDVCNRGANQTAVIYPDVNYTVLIVDEDGTISGSTQKGTTVGAVAIDYNPTSGNYHVLRYELGTEQVVYDRILSNLTSDIQEVIASTSFGTPNAMTIVSKADDTCAIFWEEDTADGGFQIFRSDALANVEDWYMHSQLISRAVRWTDGTDERIAVCISHDSELQTQYLLVDAVSQHDFPVIARFAVGVAISNPPLGRRALVNIQVTSDTVLSMVAPTREKSITITDRVFGEIDFDPGIRRWVFTLADPRAYNGVDLGARRYAGGGMVTQYGGEKISEAGFFAAPEVTEEDSISDTGGQLGVGSVSYRFYWEHREGALIERSTYITTVVVDLSGLADENNSVTFEIPTLPYTKKKCVLAVYRKLLDGAAGEPFYRCSSLKSSEATYVENDPTVEFITWTDSDFSDADIAEFETDYISQGELDNVPLPGCPQFISSGQSRVFAVIAGDPYTIWFSKIVLDGDIAAFNPELVIRVPEGHGPVTGIVPGDAAAVERRAHAPGRRRDRPHPTRQQQRLLPG